MEHFDLDKSHHLRDTMRLAQDALRAAHGVFARADALSATAGCALTAERQALQRAVDAEHHATSEYLRYLREISERLIRKCG